MEFVFTITQGRTGTASIAKLFGEADPDALSVHELLDVNAHGVFTPDIGIMRRFNTFGLTDEIKAFWRRKLSLTRKETLRKGKERYVETSNMNAKAGIVEYALEHGATHDDDTFRFLIVDRAPEKIARSMYERRDMTKIANIWLWFLHPEYPKNLVKPKSYLEHGYPGMIAWFVQEMEARKGKYERALSDKYDVVRVNIDHPNWTEKILTEFGLSRKHTKEAIKENTNAETQERADLEEKFRELFSSVGA